MDFVLLFDVKDGNPNGDPDAGNLPRMDPINREGIVTDVCIKRKIRDYLDNVLERPIFIKSQEALNTCYFKAARAIKDYDPDNDRNATEQQKKDRMEEKDAVESLLSELDLHGNDSFRQLIDLSGKSEAEEDEREKKRREFRDWLIRIEVDGLEFDSEAGILRYLGEDKSKKNFQTLLSQDEFEPDKFKDEIATLAGLLAKAKPAKSPKQRKAREAIKAKMCELYDDIRLFGAVLTAGTNAGQIRGPMQLTFARSVKPILQQDAAITRCAITKESDRARKETEFGRKPWLSYAAYRQHGFFNAPLAAPPTGTGITRDDLARFWEALACMFPNSASASKGLMTSRDLVVFVHPNSRGAAPVHKLFERTKLVESDKDEFSFEVEDADKLKAARIKVHQPLRDIWPDF
jgi:CRISPR-associated protein Csd2